MLEEDILSPSKQKHELQCDLCQNTIEVISLKDNQLEDYTIIYISCQCGCWYKFEIPVKRMNDLN